MIQSPNNSDMLEMDYISKKNKWTRTSRVVVFFLLLMMASIPIGWLSIAVRSFNETRKLNKLSTLMLPSLSEDYESRLELDPTSFAFPIQTKKMITNKYLDDRNMFAGYIRIQAAHSYTFRNGKTYLPTHITLFISAQTPASLPVNNNGSLSFITTQTYEIPYDSAKLSRYGFAPKSDTQTMSFEVPTEIFVLAINNRSLSLELEDHSIKFTEDQFLILQDFAATLDPIYNEILFPP